jgi:hypothetical protein
MKPGPMPAGALAIGRATLTGQALAEEAEKVCPKTWIGRGERLFRHGKIGLSFGGFEEGW